MPGESNMLNLLAVSVDDSRDLAGATQLACSTLAKIGTGLTGDADVRHFFSSTESTAQNF
jgi:hypothetical protein